MNVTELKTNETTELLRLLRESLNEDAVRSIMYEILEDPTIKGEIDKLTIIKRICVLVRESYIKGFLHAKNESYGEGSE